LNETFLVTGTGIDHSTFEMLIFDRWGKQIFKSTNISEGWDGSIGGTPAQEDVYAWKVHFRDTQKKAHEFIGKVTLIR
jgi:gliding motility-associated-like protein